ncbi:hypothetical protein ACMHYJ_01970 [Castellaniella hirudinis]|uniref:hypothetical protein n=1 Tax=Castellaniella hirudinis TaxID=1144617 RepID=UPI0039C08D89
MKINSTGNRKTMLATVSRDIIIRGPTTHVAAATVDVVVSLPDEPTNVERVIAGAVAGAVTYRAAPALETIWSPIQIVQMRTIQVVRAQLALTWPVSVTTARLLLSAAVVRRQTVPGDRLSSTTHVAGGAVYAIQRMAPMSNPRSSIRAISEASWALIRRYTAPVASSGLDVAGAWSMSVVHRDIPVSFSRLRAHGLATWSISSRTVEDPKSHLQTSASSQHTVISRNVSVPMSRTQMHSLASLVLVQRESAAVASVVSIAGAAHYSIVRREVEPLGLARIYQAGMVALQPRSTDDPPRSWRLASGIRQTVVQSRPTVVPPGLRSALKVGEVLTSTLVARWTIHPDLVSNPSTGRHVSSASVQFLLSRRTPSPSEVMHPDAGQHVTTQVQQVIVHAAYPDIRRPKSKAGVTQLSRQVARRMQMPTSPAMRGPVITISWGW